PTWWYSRRICPHPSPMPTRQFGRELSALLRLGFVFMASGLLTFGAAYAIRPHRLQDEAGIKTAKAPGRLVKSSRHDAALLQHD
ncbi:hypothetical protein ACC675_37520, partial [Rhizobium ruizarguesonis]